MVEHAFEFHAGESGGAAHGQQASGVRPHPIIELAAQFGGFVELHNRLAVGIAAIVGDKRFDADHIGRQFAHFLERQHGMLQMIEHAEEQHDIETSEAFGGP